MASMEFGSPTARHAGRPLERNADLTPARGATREEPRVKVLHVLGTLGRGGMETWLLQLSQALHGGQLKFDILIYHAGPLDLRPEFERLGVGVFCLPLSSGLLPRLKFAREF